MRVQILGVSEDWKPIKPMIKDFSAIPNIGETINFGRRIGYVERVQHELMAPGYVATIWIILTEVNPL